MRKFRDAIEHEHEHFTDECVVILICLLLILLAA